MAGTLEKIRQAYRLFKSIDFEQLNKLSKKVDLQKVMEGFSKLDDKQLKGLMKMMEGGKKEKVLPEINADFYELHLRLSDEDRALQLKVREFMEREIAPIVNNYWLHDEFPYEIIPKFAELNVCGLTYKGYGCPGKSFLMEGIIAMEMGRVDASIATFFGVQSGLAMGSIYLCGSEEQKQEWLPGMQQFKTIGAFGLTEPEVGSGAAGGLTVTAQRTADGWVLNGQRNGSATPLRTSPSSGPKTWATAK